MRRQMQTSSRKGAKVNYKCNLNNRSLQVFFAKFTQLNPFLYLFNRGDLKYCLYLESFFAPLREISNLRTKGQT